MALRFLASSIIRHSKCLPLKTVQRTNQLLVTSTNHIRFISNSSVLRAAEPLLPKDEEHATGAEKKELDALMDGKHDPFGIEVQKDTKKGTKYAPILVPSMYEERIVGCVCEEDSNTIFWMILKKDKLGRCANCGNCFQLVSGSPIDIQGHL